MIDDGTQRVEIYAFGHSHTSGDAVAYLPKHKILCTGDACVNGAFNFMGHANSAGWISDLEKMQKLDVDLVCPGHGKVSTKDLLGDAEAILCRHPHRSRRGSTTRSRWMTSPQDLGHALVQGVDGKEARAIKDNVKHVYDELKGKIDYDRLGQIAEPLTWPGTLAPIFVGSGEE